MVVLGRPRAVSAGNVLYMLALVAVYCDSKPHERDPSRKNNQTQSLPPRRENNSNKYLNRHIEQTIGGVEISFDDRGIDEQPDSHNVGGEAPHTPSYDSEFEYYGEDYDEEDYDYYRPIWINGGSQENDRQNTTKITVDPGLQKRRELSKQIRLHSIKTYILDRLGLREPPNITVDKHYPDRLRKDTSVYFSPFVERNSEEKTLYGGPDEYLAKTLHALQPLCTLPHKTDNTWNSEEHFRLHFDTSNNDFTDNRVTIISSAILRVYKRPLEGCTCEENSIRGSRSKYKQRHKNKHIDDEEDNTIRITVYQYLRPLREGRKEKKTMVSTTIINKNYNGWVKLDLKPALKSWMKKPKKNYGISIVAQDSDDNVIPPDQIFAWPNCSDTKYAPPSLVFPVSLALLEGHSHNAAHIAGYNSSIPSLDIISVVTSSQQSSVSDSKRHKRGTPDRKLGLKKPSCSTHETYIKFEDLKWEDWVIQPLGFTYTTCRGSCSRLPREKYFDRKVAPSGKNNFKPVVHGCCGPTKVKPLQILHFDEKRHIMLSIFEDFIISECGCNSNRL